MKARVQEKHKEEIPRTSKEIRENFVSQVQLLQDLQLDCNTGKNRYVLSMATSLRVLLHNTRRSHALLNLFFEQCYNDIDLNSGVPFLSSATPFSLEEVTTRAFAASRLISYSASHDGSPIVNSPPKPLLEDCRKSSFWTTFYRWWDQDYIVMLDDHSAYTRKDVLCCVANKLGGAHFDPEIPNNIHKLINNYSQSLLIPWSDGTEWRLQTSTMLEAIVRQIAFEFLVSANVFVNELMNNQKNPEKFINLLMK